MSEDPLAEELERLHAMLEAQQELSVQQREKLQLLASDIEAALGRSEAASPEMSEQLEDMIREFEANHPTVTDLLRRIVSGLANLGI